MKIFSIVSKVIGLLLFVGILIAGFTIPDKMINDYINEEDLTLEGYVPSENNNQIIRPGENDSNVPGDSEGDSNNSNNDNSDNSENENTPSTEPVSMYTVFLTTDAHCTVVSANPAIVMEGQNAEFTVVFENNYIVDSIEGGEYIGGKVVVNTCMSDRIISLSSKQKNVYYNFDYVQANEKDGIVTCSTETGRVLGNQTITLVATPTETAQFLGWSLNGTVVDGGVMISYAPTYTFILKEDIQLYPNFLKEGYAMVKYNLNGGVLTDDGVTNVIIEQYNLKIKPCVNLMGDTGIISRSGHTLLEFTTNPDGSGTAINPGGIADIPDSGMLELWAQWSEWNPAIEFDYSVSNNQVTITGFMGDGPVLSIPETIEGVPVTTVKAGAIKNCQFTTIVFPKSIRVVETGAVTGCKNLDIVYLFDTVTGMKDDWATNSNKYKNLRLNAAIAPTYVVNAESVATRWEYVLTRDTNKPMILLVGGSSCLYGFNSPLLEELLNNKYYVLNAGTNAGGTGMLYIEALSKFMQAGDIVCNVPEYSSNQNGGVDIVWRTFRATESCYNLYRYVDISRYTHFFSALSEFNTSNEARATRKGTTYQRTNTSLTHPNCDLAGTRTFINQTWGPIGVSASYMNSTRVGIINDTIAMVTSRNVKFYFSAAPVYSNDSSPTQANCNAYYQKATESLNCPVISNPWDYRFQYDDYNNSAYHLHSEAAKERTRILYNDLMKQFQKEANNS